MPDKFLSVLCSVTEIKTVNQIKITKCFTPAISKESMPVFITNIPIGIKQSEKRAMTNEIETKSSLTKLFFFLFAPSGANKIDIEIMKDFLYGKSSIQRYFKWLCQWAKFSETKEKIGASEVIEREKENK